MRDRRVERLSRPGRMRGRRKACIGGETDKGKKKKKTRKLRKLHS
jgi:hypothetical protein